MKRIISLFSIVVILILIMAPASFAWKWTTHSDIVDSVYYNLPASKKTKINLAAMEDGSNDPDEKFHDTRCHSFSSSYYKANTWLSKGKLAYKNKNYKYASYCFGVASHYISDTFSAPHCVSGESSYLHTKYETQGGYLTPKISYTSGSIYSLMSSGYYKGKTDWSYWIKTKKSAYVQTDLNRAASVSFKAINGAMT